jgi:hypothetical protein
VKLGKAMQLAQQKSWVVNNYLDYIQHRNIKQEADWIWKIQNRPDRVREGSWSASAAGTCLRNRQFTFLGFPKKRVDDRTMNIFANGDFVHLRHQAAGLVHGYLTEVEVPVRVPALQLTGTMDGLLSNGAIAEFKSINHFGFSRVQSFGAQEKHIEQVHSYMLASERERAHIVYEDKDTNSLKEFVVSRDEKIIDKVKTDLETLNEATENKTLLPMLPECRNFRGAYNYCPYAQICENAEWPTD